MPTAWLVFLLLGGTARAEPAAAPDPARYEAMEAELHELRARLEAMEHDAASELSPGELVGAGRVEVPAGQVASEAVSLRDDVVVSGHVIGDAVSLMGDVIVRPGGRVDGDTVAIAGEVVVEPGGRVGGDRVALGLGGELSPALALTGGLDDPHHAAGALALAGEATAWVQALYHRLVMWLTLAGAGVVTVGLFPERVARVAADVEDRPGRALTVGTLGAGFLSLFALLFAIVTVGLGSPLSVLVLLALGAAWLLGFVAFCQAVGDRLPFDHKAHGRWLAFLVGAGLVVFAGSLPWMGWFVMLAASLLGVGAALSTRLGSAG